MWFLMGDMREMSIESLDCNKNYVNEFLKNFENALGVHESCAKLKVLYIYIVYFLSSWKFILIYKTG